MEMNPTILRKVEKQDDNKRIIQCKRKSTWQRFGSKKHWLSFTLNSTLRMTLFFNFSLHTYIYVCVCKWKQVTQFRTLILSN